MNGNAKPFSPSLQRKTIVDEADKAAEQEQKWRDLALSAHRKGSVVVNQATHCLNCNEPIKQGRWCDKDCRDDWEKRGGK